MSALKTAGVLHASSPNLSRREPQPHFTLLYRFIIDRDHFSAIILIILHPDFPLPNLDKIHVNPVLSPPIPRNSKESQVSIGRDGTGMRMDQIAVGPSRDGRDKLFPQVLGYSPRFL